jgi:uncharacterized membrane protein YagU involved in acid resistance
MTTRHETDRPAIIGDAAIGAAAGCGASVAMEHASSWLYEHVESPAARDREEQLREAMPTVVMAGRLNHRLGEPLTDDHVQKLGEWLHFGFGTAWGPVYALARRRTEIKPLTLGLLLGAGVSVVFDEGLTPVVGFSPPNRAFPWQTHARAFISHLVFGAAIAGLVEAGTRLTPGARR